MIYYQSGDEKMCSTCGAPNVKGMSGENYGSIGPWDAVTDEGAYVGGRKVVGMTESGSTAYSWDPATGIMWGNVWNENGGGWRSWQIPTTIAARGQGGPIATAPTGWGRVFPAPSKFGAPDVNVTIGFGFFAGILLGLIAMHYYHKKTNPVSQIVDKVEDLVD
jgi:hypothetical protein